jgi:hypothetical protein
MSLKILKKRPAVDAWGLSRFANLIEESLLEDIPENRLGVKIESGQKIQFVKPADVTIHNTFIVSGNIITYTLSVPAQNKTAFTINIDYNLIKSHANFADQTMWAISDNIFDRIKEGVLYTVTSDDLVSIFTKTHISKTPFISSRDIDGNKCPIKIFVPSKNSTINDITIIVPSKDTNDVLIDVISTVEENNNVVVSDYTATWKSLISPITIVSSKSTLNPDDTTILTVTTSDTSITEVYAESVFGIITKTRIILTNGVGTVGLSALGLSSGDQIRVKFGYKLFTGVADYTNTIA